MDDFPETRRAVENAILIAGPTASGKTAMAVDMARELDALIVNTDSMQVYDILNILTARPNEAELAVAPHVLFGHVNPKRAYSTGDWLRDVAEVLDTMDARRRVIFVGGTGLYFRALLGGLSVMPEVPPEMRAFYRSLLSEKGPEAMHALLGKRDPETANLLHPRDGQRIVRALEVLEASGRPIGDWQARPSMPFVDPASAQKYILQPPREVLRQRIAIRLQAMVANGALEEVETLLSLGLDPSLPAMKAIGVPEFAAMLRGEQSFDEAMSAAITASRQYAKRQSTWFRNQMGPDWTTIPAS
ncbi:tRNA (adenosine(37)-N6)-dimethylallyltransferase MiaA [Zhengella sp. ZM62]|uniref:tRNA (adenosine(37)-N6)-dimethylallyltransferase MiaA n=1 Tax=Zhengella sedimenti TaxID=3390035 RepID=UPI003974A525